MRGGDQVFFRMQEMVAVPEIPGVELNLFLNIARKKVS